MNCGRGELQVSPGSGEPATGRERPHREALQYREPWIKLLSITLWRRWHIGSKAGVNLESGETVIPLAQISPRIRQKRLPKLRLIPLIAANFFMVSGGPYGIEDIRRGRICPCADHSADSPSDLEPAHNLDDRRAASGDPLAEGGRCAGARALGCSGYQEAWLSMASSIFDMAIIDASFSIWASRAIVDGGPRAGLWGFGGSGLLLELARRSPSGEVRVVGLCRCASRPGWCSPVSGMGLEVATEGHRRCGPSTARWVATRGNYMVGTMPTVAEKSRTRAAARTACHADIRRPDHAQPRLRRLPVIAMAGIPIDQFVTGILGRRGRLLVIGARGGHRGRRTHQRRGNVQLT